MSLSQYTTSRLKRCGNDSYYQVSIQLLHKTLLKSLMSLSQYTTSRLENQ
ncbi:hypothetical protein [uncultured Methanobrevibacter sp.]|nr:hypothetical protein [uncultured Methanobrevibacter sp.]